MRIENEAIEKLRRDVDLVALVRLEGVALKKRGRNWIGPCPFHDDRTPSFVVNPKTQLFNCFGCETGGNAITFLMKHRSLSFRAAYDALLARAGAMPAPPPEPKPDAKTLVRRQKLLARVAAYYRRCFGEKPAARAYLERRGITDAATLEASQVGYADSTLLSIAPSEPEVLCDLKALGVLTESGCELLANCVVFPLFDEDKRPVGIYGRKLEDGAVNHLYLPGPRRGLVHRAGAKAERVVLCESVLDALTLSCHGIPALGCYGVQGFTDDHAAALRAAEVREVRVAFDGDDAGRQHAAALARRLHNELKKPVRLCELPDGEDINSLAVKEGIAKVAARLGLEPRTHGAEPGEATTYERTAHGFILSRGRRTYEVKGIARQNTQLRATLKATRDDGHFELATIDLYSHRSRAWFAEQTARLYDVKLELTQADMADVLLRIESYEADAQTKPVIEITDRERQDAEALLASPKLLDEVAQDLERAGYTGERTNKLICYLTAVSRKLETPLSVLIQSRSAAGKSALQEAVLRLVPEEDALHYSRITDQALFYQREDALVHKLLAIEEAEGMGGAAYSIRAMQSAKKLTVAATGKDPTSGKMTTEEYTVRGPVAVMLTTTRADFDQETMSRFLCLTVDESAEMTRRIHQAQRQSDTLEGLLSRRTQDRVSLKHHNAQRLLEAVHVVNPYAPHLSFPAESLKSRRDHTKYLGLIKAIAYLHQKQRVVKEIEHEGETVRYIEATLDDIALANDLARAVLHQSISDLTPQGQKLLGILRAMLKAQSNGTQMDRFTRRELREYSRWSDWQVKTHLAELVELEHVHALYGKKGREYLYEMPDSGMDPAPFGLAPTEALRTRLEELGGKSGHLAVEKRHLAALGGGARSTQLSARPST